MGRRESVNIVILGASYAGLSVAHQFLRKTINDLNTTKTAPNYKVTLVAPNTELYWNIGAPRAICGKDIVPHRQAFTPFLETFNSYSESHFKFVRGEAINVDFTQRTVEVERTVEPQRNHTLTPKITENIEYHALIIATGASSHSKLLSLHGSHENTMQSLDQFRAGLGKASSILVVGGGPSGVECAGNLASFVKRAHRQKHEQPKQYLGMPLPKAVEPQPGVAITLISGSSRLLPRLKPELGTKAEQMLRELGVNIIHNVRLISAQELPSRATRCFFTNELTVACDMYIPATGVSPNTSFMPAEYLDASGFVLNETHFLRIPRAGERVYAIGACCVSDRRSLNDIFDSVPTLLHNLRNDLLEWEIKVQHPYGGGEDKLEALQDVWFEPDMRETMLCPISKRGGVGIIKDHVVPSPVVWLKKGKDYGFGKARKFVNNGERPV